MMFSRWSPNRSSKRSDADVLVFVLSLHEVVSLVGYEQEQLLPRSSWHHHYDTLFISCAFPSFEPTNEVEEDPCHSG